MWICRRESHFYGEIGHYVLVGEVPSVASALPNQRGVIEAIDSHRWRHAAAMGAMRCAMPSPPTPDCRGGVFATRRFPRPPGRPCARTIPTSRPHRSPQWAQWVHLRPRGHQQELHRGGSRRGAPRRYKDPAGKAHQNRPAGRVGTGMRAIPHPGRRCARSFAARMAEEGLLSNAARFNNDSHQQNNTRTPWQKS